MHDKHIAEPLDYLYEELPPEQMEEARTHLSACPGCRERVRALRDPVKQYRKVPRPAPPAGLAARAAQAALHAAKSAPAPEPVPEPAPETRQAKLEEDFERLKKEVKEEMRTGWRQWFFHPAWTVAASALLAASLAIHFSPRTRSESAPRTLYLRENTPPPVAARSLRERTRIPAAPRPDTEPEEPLRLTEAPPAALRQANARADLPLPALAEMKPAQPPVPEPAVVSEPLDDLAEAEMEAEAGMDMADTVEMAASEAPAMAAAAPTSAPAPAAAPAAPQPKWEPTPLLAPEELAALAAAPVDEAALEDSPTIVQMMEMEPPRLIERPEGFDAAERVRTLTTLAALQIANGELADALKTTAMLRRYDAAAAAELNALITEAVKAAEEKQKAEEERKAEEKRRAEEKKNAEEAEKAAAAEKTVEPAPTPEPVSLAPAPVYIQQPVSLEIVTEELPVVVSEPQPPADLEPGLRDTLPASRSADLARALTNSLSTQEPPIPVPPLAKKPIIPLKVFIRPAPANKQRERFTTDPYLRDD